LELSRFTSPSGLLVDGPGPDGASYWAFVPADLPPPIDVERSAIAELAMLLTDAEHWLGRLVGIGSRLPNPDLLVRPQMRQEAVLSSRIEGTQTSFSDLMAYEVEQLEMPGSDVREVHNYLVALDYGLRTVQQTGVTTDLVRELHRKLMTGARGAGLAHPDEFRFQQNHIGTEGTNDPADARFVPPPPMQMQQCLDRLFQYVGEEKPTPALVELAWVHYQFETIHPFNDGMDVLADF
jgi:Fic family protein